LYLSLAPPQHQDRQPGAISGEAQEQVWGFLAHVVGLSGKGQRLRGFCRQRRRIASKQGAVWAPVCAWRIVEAQYVFADWIFWFSPEKKGRRRKKGKREENAEENWKKTGNA
jgi:hypothetical protein